MRCEAIEEGGESGFVSCEGFRAVGELRGEGIGMGSRGAVDHGRQPGIRGVVQQQEDEVGKAVGSLAFQRAGQGEAEGGIGRQRVEALGEEGEGGRTGRYPAEGKPDHGGVG